MTIVAVRLAAEIIVIDRIAELRNFLNLTRVLGALFQLKTCPLCDSVVKILRLEL